MGENKMIKVYKEKCVLCGKVYSMPFKHRESDFYCGIECMSKSIQPEKKIKKQGRNINGRKKLHNPDSSR